MAEADLGSGAASGGFDATTAECRQANVLLLAEAADFAYGRSQGDALRAAGFAVDLQLRQPGGAVPSAGVWIDAADAGGGRGAAATSTQACVLRSGGTLIVAFRGTEPKLDDWRVDLDAGQCDGPAGGRVHQGFSAALDAVWPALRECVAAASCDHLWLTGHSLGGALAMLAAYRLCRDDGVGERVRGALRGVVTFGQPRVGDWEFAGDYEQVALGSEERMLGLHTWRVVNKDDVVPRVPPPQLGYRHAGRVLYIAGDGRLAEVDGDDDILVDRLGAKLAALRRGELGAIAEHAMERYKAALGDPRNAGFAARRIESIGARQVLWRERRNFEALAPGSTADPSFPVGLALSGGGIRSATLNLGVLQALDRCGLLRQVDYLSTVSGGGYIGAWLSAWSSRLPEAAGPATARPGAASAAGDSGEPEPVTWLRRFSNYLTPRTGPFSGDTLTGVATWLRNTVLNQTLLAACIAAVILLVWAALPLLAWHREARIAAFGFWSVLVVAGIALGVAEATAADSGGTGDGGRSRLAVGILALVALGLPLVATGAVGFGEAGVAAGHRLLNLIVWGPPLGVVVAFLACTALIALCAPLGGEPSREWWSRACGRWLHVGLGWWVVAGIALYTPFITRWLQDAYVAAGGLAWLLTTGAGLLAALGARTGEGRSGGWRETAARAAPYLFIVGIVGLIAMGVYKGLERVSPFRPDAADATCRSPAPTPGWETSHRVVVADDTALVQARDGGGNCSYVRYAHNSHYVIAAIGWPAWGLMAGALALAIFGLGYFVDVNRFSFHFYYRNRLERCYLGASNRQRRPNRYTGLDDRDSPQLKNLARVRPYPLINACLNLTYDPGSDAHSDRLGWQERKGAAFLFSPLACGYRLAFGTRGINAYQPTADFAARARLVARLDRLQALLGGDPARPQGFIGHLATLARRKSAVSLGMAMTISGAAASPNWGYHSSPATAFLMTVFNARLGWWMQNPRRPQWWAGGEPDFSARLMLQELLGRSSDRHEFVYLSDGGHFENLGIYELVRRRCKVVIACDAGADPAYGFEDLGNAVRKCRTDFGVEIEIDPRAVVPGPDGLSAHHCAVGLIRYPETPEQPGSQGQLLYIKTSLTGEEPADLLQYKAQFPDFPQQSTLDQWFDESQFESYRRLGQHVAEVVVCREAQRLARAAAWRTDFVALLDRLWRRWHRPSPHVGATMTRHGETLERLTTELRENAALAPLDAQLAADWARIVGTAPATAAPTREIVYFCANLFQLMEEVYLDLHLESEHGHPDVQGWMNLFRQWARADLVRTAWAVFGSTYGRRFLDFCQSRLDFPEPRLALEPPAGGGLPVWVEDDGRQWHAEQAAIYAAAYAGWDVDTRAFSIAVGRHVLPFGYAVVGGRGDARRLLDFWIRPHLRGLGLGRRAALELAGAPEYAGLGYRRDIGGANGRGLRDVLRAANVFQGE